MKVELITTFQSIMIALIVLLVAATVFLIYLGFLRICKNLFNITFRRPEPMPAVDRSPTSIDQSTVFGKGRNWFYTNRNEYLNVRIQSFDNAKMSGYYRPSADRSTRFAVILLHDYNEHPSEMAAYARLMMKQMQCHILIPHMRAHAMSGGKYCTYGLYESVDLMRWIEFLKMQVGPDCRIFVVGRGMGAATALLAAEQEGFSSNVAGILADSTFDSLQNLLEFTWKPKYKALTKFTFNTVNKICMKNLNVDITKCDPLFNADLIRVPVLFFGAGNDSVNPPNSVRAVYDDIRTPKHLVMVDKCEHDMCYDRAPAAYERETRQFVEKCVVRLVSTGKM